MNFDYIEASIFTGKDNINLSSLEHISTNKYGYSNYSISSGFNQMKIKYNPSAKLLKLEGSLPYFSEGQNFSNDMNKLKESIYTISDTLNIDLFKAEVNQLDTGITFQVKKKPKDYIQSHYSLAGFKPVLIDNTKYFNSKDLIIKMYDSGANIKKKLSKEIKHLIQIDKGYNPNVNYLRFEPKYKNPKAFFHRPDLNINQIFKTDFIYQCKQEIMNKYKAIKKGGYFAYPKDKRNLTLPVIELLALKELGQLYGFNPEEVLKRQIKAIPEGILSKEDKKNRNRSLRAILKKLDVKDVSEFDLSKELEEALNLSYMIK